VLFMLHAEYLVAEQAKIYSSAQGLSGPRYWTWVDFIYRLSTKGVFRVLPGPLQALQARSRTPAPG
jgi:hypothetical protein